MQVKSKATSIMLKFDHLPFNFLALEKQNFKKAKFVILPLAYDALTTEKGGARGGPLAIIEASRQLEWFDLELKKDIKEQTFIFTFDEIFPPKDSAQDMVSSVRKLIGDILRQKKIPVLLGGDHSLTIGAVQGFCDIHKKKFSVLQLDAHSDLRDEFEGTKYSHACVMRRIDELGIPNVQVGIRSMSEGECNYIREKKKKVFFLPAGRQGAPDMEISKIISGLSPNVYLTIDLDVFDPSFMPSVGTPEPGGLGWYEILDLVREVAKKKRIIGLDLVELCPIPGLDFPNVLAAKLLFKILNYIYYKKG